MENICEYQNNLLCQYKNTFGEPKKGLHAYRVFDIAVIDVLATIAGAKLIQIGLNKMFDMDLSYLKVLIVLFLTGILLHRLFCVKTTVDQWIFE